MIFNKSQNFKGCGRDIHLLIKSALADAITPPQNIKLWFVSGLVNRYGGRNGDIMFQIILACGRRDGSRRSLSDPKLNRWSYYPLVSQRSGWWPLEVGGLRRLNNQSFIIVFPRRTDWPTTTSNCLFEKKNLIGAFAVCALPQRTTLSVSQKEPLVELKLWTWFDRGYQRFSIQTRYLSVVSGEEADSGVPRWL